jgi:hypothetical protein
VKLVRKNNRKDEHLPLLPIRGSQLVGKVLHCRCDLDVARYRKPNGKKLAKNRIN